MTKNNLYHAAWRLRATGVLVLALALSTFPAAFSRAVKAQAPAKATAQTPAKATAQTPAKATTSPASESKGGQKEGIKVHGHWIIDVRNPDGKLVTHREFENALDGNGAVFLGKFLGRKRWPTFWQVNLSGTAWGLSSSGNSGYIVEEGDPWLFGTDVVSRDLKQCVTIGEPHDDSPLCRAFGQVMPPGLFVLSGSIVASVAGQIDMVRTITFSCPLLQNACGSDPITFTSHTLVPLDVNGSCPPTTGCVVNVGAGQIIQVFVFISFQ